MNDGTVSIRVWGDFACFTRPEMKVERVSYPIITPSAARGILEAIFWEPQIHYLIDSVRVVKKGRWVSFRRNEVTSQVSLASAKTWMRSPERFSPIQAGGGAADGTQRNMLALADVEYILTARIGITKIGMTGGRHNLKTYLDEIERRTKRGKCFHRPAFGIREFAADFDWEPDPQAALERRVGEMTPGNNWRLIWPDEDLGLMLYDVFDHRQREIGFRWLSEEEKAQMAVAAINEKKGTRGSRRQSAMANIQRHEGELVQPQASFFQAKVRESRMECHPDRVRMITKPVEGGYAA
jgi:CRISPR-associated protein Cas5d